MFIQCLSNVYHGLSWFIQCLLLSVAHKFPLPRFYQIIFFWGAGVSSCFSRHFQQSFSPSLLHPHHQRPIGSTSSGQLSNCRSTKRSSPLQRQRRCVSDRNPIEIRVKSYKLGYWAMGSFSQNNCSTESMGGIRLRSHGEILDTGPTEHTCPPQPRI